MQPNGSMGSGPDLNRAAAQSQFVKKPVQSNQKKKYFHVSNFKLISTLILFGLIVGLLVWIALS
jgi:hypothetical protein